ncbi:hypothetical protein [Endozoicomonas sp. Mp262]|uniref:hypothetical protein n=1 Tax=Endozoicomonas sp. Mp262 TaxID=2919499 RepID=UPI0021D8D92B
MADERIPGLIDPPAVADNMSLEQWMQQVTEILRLTTGQLGESGYTYVSYNDLVNAGIFTPVATGETTDYEPASDNGTDLTPPALPLNVHIENGFSIIYVRFDYPTFDFPSYAEIWRSVTTDRSDAVLVGTTGSGQYPDNVGPDDTVYYYWVRLVKTVGSYVVYGAYHDDQPVQGQAQSQLSGAALEEGTVTHEKLAVGAVTADKINAGTAFINDLGVEVMYNLGGDESNYTMKIDLVNGFIHIK